MILHAPGYNLSLARKPVRVASAQRIFSRARAGISSRRISPCLSRLCEEIGVLSTHGILAQPIEELCMDSRRVGPGALFFALPGGQTDGSFYIEEAIDRGAVAIVTEKARQHHPRATFIQVKDARAAMAIVARRFYKSSTNPLELIGVTGSLGKSCVSHLLKHLLTIYNQPVGLLSSIHYDLGSRVVPSYRTTPEAIDLHGMLAQMRENGCRRAVLEISSHGIDQKRVLGLPLEVAVFLNLGREQAGRHGDREGYFQAKCGLFTGKMGPLPRVAAVNLDDSYGRRLIQMLPEHVRLVTFGRSPHADIRATEITEGRDRTVMRIDWPEGSARVRTRQIGNFAVSNLLAAVAAAYGIGLDLNLVLPRLFSFSGAPGRMEQVEEGQPFNLVVDSARTPEAVRHALRAIRATCGGRLFVVFGCSGQQDRSRRPHLVKAVQEEADFCWGTSDSPRNEPLGQIFNDMRCGVTQAERMVFVDDRRRAIALALDTAISGDVVVLLGKGSDAFQYVGDAALPFDDRLVARELLALREAALSNF